MKLQTRAIVNGKHVFKLAWERAKSFNAIPQWSRHAKNRRKILKIYVEAQIKNLNSKVKYQVDHIIPLYHPLVCGLHVHDNLQILTKRKNEEKSNVFYPYRIVEGRKYYFEKVNQSEKEVKIPRKYNQTKKNPCKLSKNKSKTVKNKLKTVKKRSTFFKVKS